ncbi:hypothetical protein BS47DRAFT_489941 [Hydnum rufescens UP504]|uniref:Arrestin C-terminal-like domain-containing protein n=1 Tax=Hydnum rufescens UP504 TaxID=1448309 RepID=A0A9P6AHD5_9AGAM|nr:hypothetical protein BS47DRAFT_489941 [Hydnum rufescens UP504]
MSGQLKITLRQPPNVDFVIGFPGIPGHQERPHAAVKGSVELRVGQGSPVKAKWIRVELRKIEILPGGGQTNTYSDVVGSGSFNLWTAKDEWEVVSTRDLPFQIKIPEDVPPSVALENGSGIKYELVASVCYRAKKGLFRRVTAPVMSASSPIVIDKHELHSTWPAYSQKDSRQVNKDGFTLVVERGNTCYGPGDTVLLRVTLKSSTPPVTIRSYEMALRETAVYRTGEAPKTANGPQIRSSFVGSEKLSVNVLLKSVVTATHIEVVYGIAVRATLDDGRDLVIDNIPVMMSNWSRAVSNETVKRIGWAPILSHAVAALVELRFNHNVSSGRTQ